MNTSRRLPAMAFTDLAGHLAAAPRGTAVLGLDEHDNPAIYNPTDTAHLAITGPTGTGSSSLLRLYLAQALAHGARVVLGDMKGAQRWCHDHPAVTVARTAAEIHDALTTAGEELDRRSRSPHAIEDGFDLIAQQSPIVVALDDQCLIMGNVAAHWKTLAEHDADAISPALTALAEILYTGRAWGITMASAAVLFGPQALGGPNLADSLIGQYGVRLIGPGTSSVGLECMGINASVIDAPRLSDRGTYDRIAEGTRTRFQAAYITETEARNWTQTSN